MAGDGRDRRRPRQTATAAASVTRAQLAFYGSTPAYKVVLDAHGWGDLQPGAEPAVQGRPLGRHGVADRRRDARHVRGRAARPDEIARDDARRATAISSTASRSTRRTAPTRPRGPRRSRASDAVTELRIGTAEGLVEPPDGRDHRRSDARCSATPRCAPTAACSGISDAGWTELGERPGPALRGRRAGRAADRDRGRAPDPRRARPGSSASTSFEVTAGSRRLVHAVGRPARDPLARPHRRQRPARQHARRRHPPLRRRRPDLARRRSTSRRTSTRCARCRAGPRSCVAAAAVGFCRSDDGGRDLAGIAEGLHATYCRAVAVAGDAVLVERVGGTARPDERALPARAQRRPGRSSGSPTGSRATSTPTRSTRSDDQVVYGTRTGVGLAVDRRRHHLGRPRRRPRPRHQPQPRPLGAPGGSSVSVVPATRVASA